MAQNVLIIGLTVIEAVIFWLFLRNSTKENQTINNFLMGIIIGAFSVVQAVTRFQMGEYNFLDIVVFFFIFLAMAIAILLTILAFTPKKETTKEIKTTKTVSTSNPVILTSGDTVSITRDNRSVLKITFGENGIYFIHQDEASPRYHNHHDVFGYWKSGDTALLTGISCLTITNIDQGKSITIQPNPGYLITF